MSDRVSTVTPPVMPKPVSAAPVADGDAAAVTLFEFWADGHAPNFLRLILETWQAHGVGTLRAVVTQRMVRSHPEIFDGFDNQPGSPVRWLTLDDADDRYIEADLPAGEPGTASDVTVLLQSNRYWTVMEKYASRHPARHILMMNIDECLLSIGTGRRMPSDFSGILFLPSFHYSDELQDVTFPHRVYNAMQLTLVRDRLLVHPQVRNLFSLDMSLVNSLAGRGTANIVYLPDPVWTPERRATSAEIATLRERFGVARDRKLFLLFGDLRTRKGVWKLLQAAAMLSPEEQGKICIALVGRAVDSIEARIRAWQKVLGETPLALIRREGYVPDAEMEDWFEATDVVLAPYQRHVGSSGILLLAAAHGKPVITQDFGLIGNLTREHRLGISLDATQPAQVADALRSFLAGMPAGWDEERALAFARANSRERFGALLLEALRPVLG